MCGHYSQILLVQLMLASLMMEGYATPLDNHARRYEERCLDYLSQCRRNATCLKIFKNVKRRCQVIDNECHAIPTDLLRCVEDIDYLKINSFPLECRCFELNYSIQKLLKCSELFNLIFANRCYDNGLKAREEVRRLAAVTMQALVAMKTDDVTNSNANDNIGYDVITQMTTEIHPVIENNLPPMEALEVIDANDVRSQHRSVEADLSEEELNELDSLIADDSFNQIIYGDVQHHVIDNLAEHVDDANDARHMAKVVAKVMGASLRNTVRNSSDDIISERNLAFDNYDIYNGIIEPYISSSVHDDTTHQLHVLHVVLIITGSLIISLLLAAIYVYIRYFGGKKKKYKAGKHIKGSFQSSVVVKIK